MTTDELKQIRRYLHQNPELSCHENQTHSFLKDKLEKMGVENLKTVGGTGILIRFRGKEGGRKILIRGDMDALPIQEENDFIHKSKTEGVSHKCGHDGHTTILLGLAGELQQNPPGRGEVALIFQPAEENGKGAKAVIEDPDFNFEPDMVFALHNLPGYPLHKVVCKKGPFTAAAKSVILKLKGKTSHAAEPEKGINPGLAVAEILQLSEEFSEKDTSKDDFRLITMIYVTLGEKSYGVSAGYAEVHLTLRSWQNPVMERLEKDLMKRVESIVKNYSLKLESEWLEVFYANDNTVESFESIKEAAQQEDLIFEERKEPFKWGEDFGLFTQKFSGGMFGIGAGGNCPALHNPDYDFPDEITATGIRMFRRILIQSLQK